MVWKGVRPMGKTQLRVGLGLWLLLSLGLSYLLVPELWSSIGTLVSPKYVFGQLHASPWGVLGLCLLWLYRHRRGVGEGMGVGAGPVFLLLGAGLAAAAALLPDGRDWLVLRGLLVGLGVFTALFGRAARLPTVLAAIYALSLSLPLMAEELAAVSYARAQVVPLVGLLEGLGLPVSAQGQWLLLTTVSGQPVRALVTAACAGPVTMGVFLALFSLMVLDTPLPPRRALALFLVGVAGTWLQSLLRLILLIIVAYYWGKGAMGAAHVWSNYILFPLWYLSFALLYFSQTRKGNERAR